MEEFIDRSSLGTKVCCGIGTCFVITMTSLIMAAVATVEPTEQAVLYNTWTKEVGKFSYPGGMYYAGIFSSFIKYPATVETIEFSNEKKANQKQLSTRTKEGLPLKLHFSFQYKIQTENMKRLYALTGENDHEKLYERIAGSIILQKAGDYNGPEYWSQRSEIGLAMKVALNKALQPAFADCVAFQFLNIDLPDQFEEAIVSTQIEKQTVSLYLNKRKTQKVLAETEVETRDYTQQILIVNARADADALKLTNVAEGTMRKIDLDFIKEAWVTSKAEMGLENNDLLLKYIYLHNLMNLKNQATLVYGLNEPTLRIGTRL